MSAIFIVISYVAAGILVARRWFPRSGPFGIAFSITFWPLLLALWSLSGCGRE